MSVEWSTLNLEISSTILLIYVVPEVNVSHQPKQGYRIQTENNIMWQHTGICTYRDNKRGMPIKVPSTRYVISLCDRSLKCESLKHNNIHWNCLQSNLVADNFLSTDIKSTGMTKINMWHLCDVFEVLISSSINWKAYSGTVKICKILHVNNNFCNSILIFFFNN